MKMLQNGDQSNVVITNNDATDFKRIKNYFDLIVVDTPCSGSGLFRKDNEAIDEWSENNVQLMQPAPAKDIGRCIYIAKT